MSILDRLAIFNTAQAVTATAVSVDNIDLGVARDVFEGEPLYVQIGVDVTAVGAGASVAFEIIQSATANMASPTVIGSSGDIAVANLTQGALFAVEGRPQIGSVGQRYIAINYRVTTGPLTAGAFTAAIVKHVADGRKFYASGFSVQ
jgi:hypothetical protein